MMNDADRHLQAVPDEDSDAEVTMVAEPGTQSLDAHTLDEAEGRVDAVLDAVDAALGGEESPDAPREPTDADVDAGVDTDPLLARAARLPDIPLHERPGAIDSLNRALVQELNTLEDL